MKRKLAPGYRRLTRKDFTLFKYYFKKWQKKLAPGFRIFFSFEELDNKNVNADISPNKSGGTATVRLNKVKSEGNPFDLMAFHEACHLLLSRFRLEAGQFLAETYLNEIEHEIIRKLENIIFEKEED